MMDISQIENLQIELSARIIQQDALPQPLKIIAGCDVEYDKESDIIAGAVVLLDYNTLTLMAVASHVMKVTFPYRPGFFSFREMPPLVEAFHKLPQRPDLLVCDAHGIAHPRHFGLASHLGVTLDVPTIGCGKTRLYGKYGELAAARGSITDLTDEKNGTVIGKVLRTQTGINPVFVSVGHKISLTTACDTILKLATTYRLPETTRIADHYAREAFLKYKT